MLLSERELAIQNHPKHLEKLFEMMKINRGLKPKQVPVHQLLDEPDETDELAPDKAKIFRSCIGILLYIASDFVECQYANRGLAQVMSKPSVQAFLCLRHLCLYLLGCVDHCTVMTYSDHQGLLHYTPSEYTMEVYSDSDWAKHRSTCKSFSSGHICLFGNLLYSSSRTKTIALSSAEAKIYAFFCVADKALSCTPITMRAVVCCECTAMWHASRAPLFTPAPPRVSCTRGMCGTSILCGRCTWEPT